jgi:hypothetical protein
MKTLAEELEVRERSATGSRRENSSNKGALNKGHHTAASLLTGQGPETCVYCRREHASECCRSVNQVEARKQILRSSGRCFWCLKRGHLGRNCQLGLKCTKCNGSHHISHCYQRKTGNQVVTGGTHEPVKATGNSSLNPQALSFEDTHAYTTLYSESSKEVLIQTGRAPFES